jgi:hypothetical protein
LLMNTTTGNIGVGNNPSPQAMLHVVRGAKTNGPLLSSSAVVIDGDLGGWVQLSNNNNIESGVLSGNQQTPIRSGVVFGTDSSVQIRAGGNFSQLTIDKLGNVSAGNNISAGGNANIAGNAIVTGEVRRVSTGSANMVPICYGSVNLIGGIQSGSGNFTITWNGAGSYTLAIDGENPNVGNCISSITTVGVQGRLISISNSGNNSFFIHIRDALGTLTDNAFHFVIFKP